MLNTFLYDLYELLVVLPVSLFLIYFANYARIGVDPLLSTFHV